jgi:hypothetical protein
MSEKAGALLWNRMRVEFPPNTGSVDVDTGLTQVTQSFAGMSPNEPPLSSGLQPSRVQVIPLAPTANWAGILHTEPVLDPATGTIHVTFHIALTPEPPFQLPPLNVLFWNPHSIVGPGEADFYNTQE